jgi:hypothetical protein
MRGFRIFDHTEKVGESQLTAFYKLCNILLHAVS